MKGSGIHDMEGDLPFNSSFIAFESSFSCEGNDFRYYLFNFFFLRARARFVNL
jgi:hypothetical protein